jgi:septal ring factor EnvC (AmiA/AmiB activator)
MNITLKQAVQALIALVIAALIVALVISRNQLRSARAQGTKLQTQVSQLQDQQQQLEVAIFDQNQAIESWKAEAIAAQARAEQAAKAAAKVHSSTQAVVARVLLAPAPTDAAGALSWAVDQAGKVEAELENLP